MLTRGLTRADFLYVVSVIDQWWAGPTAALAHPVFFYEFGQHARVIEDEGRVVGFLFGLVTEGSPRVGYIHLVGIDPEYRRRGVGRRLYEEFERHARDAGALRLKAITTPGNQGSIGFHQALGYAEQLVPDYAGPNRPRHVFTRELAAGGGARSR